MNKDKEQQRMDDLQRIKQLCLFDDEFMTACLSGDTRAPELILKIILERDDLKVLDSQTQKTMKNLAGRDVRLDIYATDSDGKLYDIEIQRENKGADIRRARYHSSMIDANMLKPGDSFIDLHENYVIFITENDVLGQNRPIYHIERVIKEGNVQIDDGAHIIYVNGSMRTEDTALGKLVNDFYCTDAKDMHYKELADRVRAFKETTEGEESMSNVLEEMKDEARYDKACEIALRMIECGKLSLEEIAECSGLSIEKVRELAGEKPA